MTPFNVKSKSFPLYKAFKEECERIGWEYNTGFTPFEEEKMRGRDCLYFLNGIWGNLARGPLFAFSNSDSKTFYLESQFGEALVFAKEQFKSKPKRWRASLIKTYFAFDFEGDVLETSETGSIIDDALYENGNYFETREEAEKAWIKVKELLVSLHKVS